MKLSHAIYVASILTASPASSFSPAAQHVNRDVSFSPLVVQPLPAQLHSPSRRRSISLFSAATGEPGEETATGKPGKEIDLLDEADAIFDSVDVNKDGVISAEELRSHLIDNMGYSADYTMYLFASLDADSDGVITREEMRSSFYNFEALSMYMTFGVGGSEVTSRKSFKTLVLNQSTGSRDKLLLDDLADLIFDMIDTDKSGEIDKKELLEHFEQVTSKFEEGGTAIQAIEYVSTMFATLDANNDGTIDRTELRGAFQKYDFKLLAKTFGLRVYRTAEV